MKFSLFVRRNGDNLSSFCLGTEDTPPPGFEPCGSIEVDNYRSLEGVRELIASANAAVTPTTEEEYFRRFDISDRNLPKLRNH